MKRSLQSAINPLILTLLIALMIYSHCASASITSQLKLVGQGKMSWLWMDIYHISLLTEDGIYQPQKYPQALAIKYNKNLSKGWLIQATDEQWQKIGIQTDPVWLKQLTILWPDIKSGDSLMFVVQKDGKGLFYYNQQLLGGIDDITFSDAFLAIWLDKNSSEPDLRFALIGALK